ncbi:DUF4386 domain-containing protein [Fusibacter ferrireducens]|uniref:DUF4386 domain-containing protein n=1 Tax=Fusibacter ferrireducens TaxID=2785058 RepID=A0ABR9ZRB4_9FIRM|nr:DUF4386 domain-containing protein [Fusibacter ferrireducens]MBF4692179.1 DUF4386 domain-containing protein [Fusibacter ferrireducens]
MMKIKRNIARIAGLLYVAVAITGFFSNSTNGKLITGVKATTIAENMNYFEWLFRISIVSDLMMVVSWIMLAYMLYTLFETVNKNQGLLMISFVLVGSATICVNALNKLVALFMLKGVDGLSAFNLGGPHYQALLFLDLFKGGNYIAHIFFGLWLFPLGYLVYKSKFMPRILAILLTVAGFGYLTDFFTYFLLPDYGLRITQFTFWGEVLLLIWLLIKGIKVPPEEVDIA